MPEGDVAVRPLLTTRRLIGCANGPLQHGLHLLGRPILLGEQDVESDGRDIALVSASTSYAIVWRGQGQRPMRWIDSSSMSMMRTG